MHPISFERLGRTLVLSDLHMHALVGEFEKWQEARIRQTIQVEQPETIVLNGDTIDVLFSVAGARQPVDVEDVLQANKSLVRALTDVNSVYILPGAHDQAIRWDHRIRDLLLAFFPNCRGFYDGLVDETRGITVVSGSQWYYDNVVHVDEEWLSLTAALTKAFEDFLLSGQLTSQSLQTIYVSGQLSFWYRTGSHYRFLQGLGKAFGCRVDQYFDSIARIFREPYFSIWADNQFYEEFRAAAHIAILQGGEGGALLEELAAPYWKTLGRIVKARLGRYLAVGILDYPPYSNLAFRTAIVGHTHLVQTLAHNSGRSILFTGSTKAQTRINEGAEIAQNECTGGYVTIGHDGAHLRRFETKNTTTNLRQLSDQWTSTR